MKNTEMKIMNPIQVENKLEKVACARVFFFVFGEGKKKGSS